MKIIYNIAGFYRPAGMERTLANKANWLAAHGCEILIVTTDQRGQEPVFHLEPSIRLTDLDINYEENNGGSFLDKLVRYPFKQFRHRSRLTALLKREKADIVVSMFCNDASFIPLVKDGSRKVLEIHFSRFKRLQYGRKGLWRVADRLRAANDVKSAARFDRFVVLTEEDRGYWGDMPNICVIPNARTFTPDSIERNPSHTVLAAGRLTGQKGIDRLLKVWEIVKRAPSASDWRLRIVGDGELRSDLMRQAVDLDIADSVEIGPVPEEIRKVYGDAAIYAMTSRYEGLPMVLLEAQAAGLPIVAMKCKCGPLDVVTDGIDGILVEDGDIQGTADGILKLVGDDSLRCGMGDAALQSSERFAEEKIMEKWTELFKSVM